MTPLYVTWLIDMWHATFMCDMTHWYVTWLIHMRHDSFMCDVGAAHGMCDMTHSYVTWLIHMWRWSSTRYMTWLMHMWRDSITYDLCADVTAGPGVAPWRAPTYPLCCCASNCCESWHIWINNVTCKIFTSHVKEFTWDMSTVWHSCETFKMSQMHSLCRVKMSLVTCAHVCACVFDCVCVCICVFTSVGIYIYIYAYM